MGVKKLIQFLPQINRSVALKSTKFPLDSKQIPIGQNQRKGRPPKHFKNIMKIILFVLLILILIHKINSVIIRMNLGQKQINLNHKQKIWTKKMNLDYKKIIGTEKNGVKLDLISTHLKIVSWF
jgi:hypothetical protein